MVQDATSAMINRLAEWSRSFYAEGNEEVTPLPDFIQIKIHIVRLLLGEVDMRLKSLIRTLFIYS